MAFSMLNMKFSDRLRLAMREAPGGPISPSELARRVNLSRSSVSQWLSDQTKSLQSGNLYKVADALNVNPKWLLEDKQPMRKGGRGDISEQAASPILQWDNPEDLPADDYVLVRQRLVRPSAGDGNLVFEEEPGPPLAFTTRWVQNEGLRHSDLVIVEVDGDSMEPSIRHGDSILVDTGSVEVHDGKVYVIRYRDELRVKRLFSRYDGALIIRSDNYNKFPEEVVPPQDLNGQVQVIGRVVWRAGGVF